MSKEFGIRINELIKTILDNFQQCDDIYFQQITVHKATVISFQNINAESIKFLSDKVFSMSSSLIEFKNMVIKSMEHTDNAMVLVHHQRQRVDAKYQEFRDDITLLRSQMQEFMSKVKQLSDEVNALRHD